MKACFALTLWLLAAISASAQASFTDQQVIDYAKSIDVQTLDPSLPSQRLEDWLQSGPPHVQIGYWEVAGTCDLKPDLPGDDYPLCAKVRFQRGGQQGVFLVQVGMSSEGIVGRPEIYEKIGVFEGMFVRTGTAERLSELPALLDQPVVTGGVEKLYQEIVAHHPLGIPTGAEMATLRPFLSKRLTQQLQSARACQDDYARHHSTADRIRTPGWLASGLFSGEGTHASPIEALVLRKEKQSDGSFLVPVQLEPANSRIDLSHGRSAVHGDYDWLVEARVIPEGGRYVVDDVRIFDRFDTDGPSRLLSNSFTGCDGPHWSARATSNFQSK